MTLLSHDGGSLKPHSTNLAWGGPGRGAAGRGVMVQGWCFVGLSAWRGRATESRPWADGVQLDHALDDMTLEAAAQRCCAAHLVKLICQAAHHHSGHLAGGNKQGQRQG